MPREEAEGKSVLREETSGDGMDQGPNKHDSLVVKELVRKSVAIVMSILGLAVLVLGYWLFYYGAGLKYLPKYHAIVLTSSWNPLVHDIGAWLTVVGVCALGIGGVVEIVRRLLGKHRKVYSNAALAACLGYFFYMVMLAWYLAKPPPRILWFFIGVPVAVYFVLVYDGINCLRRVWISKCRRTP